MWAIGSKSSSHILHFCLASEFYGQAHETVGTTPSAIATGEADNYVRICCDGGPMIHLRHERTKQER